jgi:hypothetical protein
MKNFVFKNAKVLQFISGAIAWGAIFTIMYPPPMDMKGLSTLILPIVLYLSAVFEGYLLRIVIEKEKKK